VVVRGRVYDVTSWRDFSARGNFLGSAAHALRRVPTHPGGPLIYVAAGKDCTHLFDSYHPLRVRRGERRGATEGMCSHHTVSRRSELLPKYHVGDLQLARDDPLVVASFEQDLGEGQFYAVLKRRVSAYFRDHKVSARSRLQALQALF
jgi:hypothetical protein